MKSFLIRDILAQAEANNSKNAANDAYELHRRLSIQQQQQQQQHNHQLHQQQQQRDTTSRASSTPSSTSADRQSNEQQQLLHKQLLNSAGNNANGNQAFALNSPLDALFQMTSNTFDALRRGEKRKGKQTSKKKRKSRTAFTNNQIQELENRFKRQKYLSPADRDEIAMSLNLSNAQVITWFQNRRAKLKRDLEEQKRDIEQASLTMIQRTLFESIRALSQLNPGIPTTDVI